MSFRKTLKSALVANALLLGGMGLAQAQAPIPVVNLHTGPNNAITDVPGILVGHSTRKDAQTGTTALLFPEGALMGMSPSGGAPGTRLAALLTAQHQDAQRVVMHGLTLSGGSIYGLDTACGVVKFLDEKGWNYGGRAHVPGAIIFDLGRGSVDAPPGRGDKPCEDGYVAASNAKDGAIEQGSVGAGTGARTAGMKSGIGTASAVMADGTVVGALVVVNAAGRVYNVNANCELYTLWLELDDEFGDIKVPPQGCSTSPKDMELIKAGQNTTIGVIATSAPLTAGQTERLAIIANDGMARAIRPAHSTSDGDTVFAVTLGDDPATVAQANFVEASQFRDILSVAADVYSRAITHAVLNADPELGETYCVRFPGACGEKAK